MPLAPGTRLGVYDITAQIGEGGMGQVYRATDTKLKRQVAIKILPPSLAADRDRLARFQREAEVLASLNHPHIAGIYGLEESPSTGSGQAVITALVMELVEGDDLSQRLARGVIPLDEALPIAKQIAEALEAAHEQGIVHRDLKPANIKVRADGTVKVLDFGLAKAIEPVGAASASASMSPTLSLHATQAGMILGTAAYMAPEQARGLPVGKRADIWAFGCVLHEMIAGKPAFAGDTVTDVLAAVVTKEPDWSALPAGTPRSVRTVLMRCLQKDPKQRLHDIADARLELETGDVAIEAGSTATGPPRAHLSWAVLAALAAAALGAGAGVGWRASRETPPVEWTAHRLGGPAIAMNPRVSPDGHLLAFLAMVDGQTQIAVMKPNAAASWNVVTKDRTQGFVQMISWSPDGSAIYYDRATDVANGIYSVPPLGGGEERLVLENAAAPSALPDGSLLFVRLNRDRVSQLHRFWPASGKIAALPVVSFERGGMTPLVAVLDDKRAVVCGRPVTAQGGADTLHVLDLGSGEVRPIAHPLGDGLVLSMATDRSTGTVLASVIDGSMVRVMRVSPDDSTPPTSVMSLLESAFIDVGREGELVASLNMRGTEIVRADIRDGTAERLMTRPLPTGAAAIELPGGSVLVGARAVSDGGIVIAPPGREPYRLVQSDDRTRAPMTVLPDGRVALMIGSGSSPDIAVVAPDTGRVLKRLKSPAAVSSLASSPDGRTLYYAAAGMISAFSLDGGPPKDICPGDSMAVDPATGDLIVKLEENERIRLMRCSSAGGRSQELPVRGKVRMASRLSPHSIRNGRLLLPVGAADSWYWSIGVLDLATGTIEKVKVNYQSDFHYATWTPDGKVLGTGYGVGAALWKFENKAAATRR